MHNVGSDGLGIEGPVQESGCNSSKSLQPEEWHESNLVLENPKGPCRKPGSQTAAAAAKGRIAEDLNQCRSSGN